MSFLRRLFRGEDRQPIAQGDKATPHVSATQVDPVPSSQASALIGLLGSENADARQSAARKLVQLGAPAVQPLITALRHADIEVCRASARTLGRIGDPRAVEPLLDIALAAGSRQLRADADKALLSIGEPALVPVIERLKRPDVNALNEAADLLGRMGDERAVDALATALIDHGQKRDLYVLLFRERQPAPPAKLHCENPSTHVMVGGGQDWRNSAILDQALQYCAKGRPPTPGFLPGEGGVSFRPSGTHECCRVCHRLASELA